MQNSLDCMEAEFFRMLIQSYLEEEETRRRENQQRKSLRRLQTAMGKRICQFFQERLEGVTIVHESGMVFTFHKDDSIISVLKIHPTLNGCRGSVWYHHIDKVTRQLCQSYRISTDRINFLVLSLMDSLDVKHVRKLTGGAIKSNAEMVARRNRELLESYIRLYVKGIKVFSDPAAQVYFLSPDKNCNDAAMECLVAKQIPSFANEAWVRPSITELVEKLQASPRA